jgi:hypothetical protein
MSEPTWRCPSCGATNVGHHPECLICHRPRAAPPAEAPITPPPPVQPPVIAERVQPPIPPQPYAPRQVPVPMAQPVYMVQPGVAPGIRFVPNSNGIGTAAGVLGIISAVLMFVPVINYLSVVLGTLAIIFGARGNRRARLYPGTPKGMAVTGLVLGIISLVIALIFIIGVYAYVFRKTAPWI